MITKKEYIEYLLNTPINYTCTNMADHKPGLSHDVVSDFLRCSKFTPSQLWDAVRDRIEDNAQAAIIVDDSVQDKRYSKFIELVKRQYSGNEHGLVKGIGLVNLIHTSGNEKDFWPIDYRVYHPDSDGKTKNDHFQEMFLRLITHKTLKTNTILFDSWYASVGNLKLINTHGWTFFTTLKSNRRVSVSREKGYQSLAEMPFDEKTIVTGITVKLKELPFKVKLFKLVAKNGDIDWVITNSQDAATNLFVAENKIDNRWQVEEFHRGFKQLTGSEKCQCRKARSQRNHLACCYLAWVSLKIKAKSMKTTIYKVRNNLFSEFLTQQLAMPTINAVY